MPDRTPTCLRGQLVLVRGRSHPYRLKSTALPGVPITHANAALSGRNRSASFAPPRTRETIMDAGSHPRHLRTMRLWLLAVAGLVFVMVLVGGATRITESGLSIVEWQPVTGTIPPLSQPEWQREFEKYQGIPQYRLLNRGMSLDEFKTIYWWEWTHRFLGRLVGVAFLLPFLWFLWRGWIEP